MTFIKKPPVQMSREMQATVDDPKEVDLARESVAKSMARLFPTHAYSHEDVDVQGKLRVVTFTYRHSMFREILHRTRLLLQRYRKGLNA